jgi:hypothetical protein
MKYSEFRSRISQGDIVALSHKSYGSWYDLQIMAIRIFDKTEYTHVGVVVEIGDRKFVLESVEPVVRLMPLSNYLDNGFYIIPMNAPMSDEEFNYGMSLVGKGKYSKIEAIRAFFKKLNLSSRDVYECAKLVIQCRRMSGIDLGNVATPSSVVLAAQNLGKPVYFIDEE